MQHFGSRFFSDMSAYLTVYVPRPTAFPDLSNCTEDNITISDKNNEQNYENKAQVGINCKYPLICMLHKDGYV